MYMRMSRQHMHMMHSLPPYPAPLPPPACASGPVPPAHTRAHACARAQSEGMIEEKRKRILQLQRAEVERVAERMASVHGGAHQRTRSGTEMAGRGQTKTGPCLDPAASWA